jgi:predicted transposase YbfD/YdcC
MAQEGRLTRRLAGMLKARLPDAGFDEVLDPRDRRGRRWDLKALLVGTVAALVAGAKSLADAEDLTAKMSTAIRRMLGISRRIPDTTLRSALCELEPDELRQGLHRVVKAAHRRKALMPQGLPFGMLVMDGKVVTLPSCDDHYAQRQSQEEGDQVVGLLRTVTCCLVNASGQPCIDAIPIPATTNEMGVFQLALARVTQAYGSLDLFRLVSYDAGACSRENALAVRGHGLHYLFGLKGTQPTLLAEAERLLAGLSPEQALASSEDVLGGGFRVVRRVYLTEQMAGWAGWEHLHTVLRVESEKLDSEGQRIHLENRYFLCSLPASRLTRTQWLKTVRLHWGVENGCHWTLDTAFQEDDRPWIEANPQGTLAVVLLRRIAYTLLGLFRSVTQRSQQHRSTPWKDLMRDIYVALVSATAEQLVGLRSRHALPTLL